MFRPASIVILMCIAGLLSSGRAQDVRAQLPVVTRLVQLYLDYEQRLAEALSRKDNGEIDRLVANDFELRPAGRIGNPIPRADWLAQSLKEAPVSISIDQMAVHDYDHVRVVSFVMKRTLAGRRREPDSMAIVDVWMQSGEAFVLKVRYSAVQTGQPMPASGESQQQKIDKRY
jgi:hypothetical protein